MDDLRGRVVAAVRADQLYVLPHPEIADLFRERAAAIVAGRTPEAVATADLPPPGQYGDGPDGRHERSH